MAEWKVPGKVMRERSATDGRCGLEGNEVDSMQGIKRIAVATIAAASILIGVAGTASADVTGTFVIHARACPADAVDIFADCHDNPVAEFVAQMSYSDGCLTGADGNCSFPIDAPSDYDTIYLDQDPFHAVYCTATNETTRIDYYDDFVDFFWTEDAADEIVCDVYVIDETLPLAHDGAAMPDTGAGPMTQGSNLGLLLAGVLALGGLAVASRRAAVR
jgi:hypothetical protein